MNPSTLRIATRKSALALWQAEHVAAALRVAHPWLTVVLVPMTTRGDEILDQPLATIGGKGLFLKELEVAMHEGRADLAVHSLKDVPATLEPGFVLPAILPRADAADAFVSNHYADPAALPPGARVGTSSLRRQAQLRALRPDLVLLDLRGNVGTRLGKLDADEYDAIVLACAGLERLGLASRIRSRLAAPNWLPAPGQGAIAIEARSGRCRYAADRQRGAGDESSAWWQLYGAGRCLVRARRTRSAFERHGWRRQQWSTAACYGQQRQRSCDRAGRAGRRRLAGAGCGRVARSLICSSLKGRPRRFRGRVFHGVTAVARTARPFPMLRSCRRYWWSSACRSS